MVHIKWLIALVPTIIYIFLMAKLFIQEEDECWEINFFFLGGIYTIVYTIFWIVWLLIFR